jgi:uncharacterized protein
MSMYEPRTYRGLVSTGRLTSFTVVVKETDLLVHAALDLSAAARELVLEHRGYLEAYLRQNPEFRRTLAPWPLREPHPAVVGDMIAAGAAAGVGPMAAVAGAIAEQVGRGLLRCSPEVIVENGGDVFLKTADAATVAIFAGKSPLSLRIGVRIACGDAPLSVCTSSGTVGPSLSFGRADAVSIVARSCALADAAATAVGNQVGAKADIAQGIERGKAIPGVAGIVIVVADQVGFWGEIEVIPVRLKKS